MSDVFRVYESVELGPDGYPYAWHETIKHLVRDLAEHRCIRCHHPYRVGQQGNGEWSRCDESCTHAGPLRYARERDLNGWYESDPTPVRAGDMLTQGRWEEVEAHWRILTVHHLNRVKADCRWWNLAALCQRCHLTIQGKVYLEREFEREHSDWFKPHAAAWYALRYLGEELTREETLARLEELLDLEFRQARLEGMPRLEGLA